ncbi:ligase-associated DNA damage response exonuclease [Pseudorhodobacter sp. E13]|uniref:ligase-associated DNA damage response exonuclease n=1 Tax=Pseudorhodobacter sp. E13 TaxID=2487931 RepID=UPI000F8E88CD|nr:ligase-associated DNA damage response exonuclease [Pseudorhodobacter sp. E13]RUS63241.1 ligase-associated DNA damage response exonuclease [Pseudorhodobacter sp. E13]
MTRDPVLRFTDQGIYCPAGDFYIDPWRPVARAAITHGHSDHARAGHGSYLATHAALPVMRHRLGQINAHGLAYGEVQRIGGANLSFHPAGHVPGSAQIRIEVGGEVWVVSGDYKLEEDGLSEPFSPIPCHAFITECTFGLPVFRWPAQAKTAAEIATWWARNAAEGRVSLLGAYGLGKAQRIMSMLAAQGLPGPLFTHGAAEATTRILRDQGYPLPPTTLVSRAPPPPDALVIAPPSALGSAWAAKLGPRSEAFASGWMALRGIRRRRNLGTGFIISDHADWDGLNSAIRATGAEKIFANHGYTAPFQRWLASQGYDAGIVATEWQGETAEPDKEITPE